MPASNAPLSDLQQDRDTVMSDNPSQASNFQNAGVSLPLVRGEGSDAGTEDLSQSRSNRLDPLTDPAMPRTYQHLPTQHSVSSDPFAYASSRQTSGLLGPVFEGDGSTGPLMSAFGALPVSVESPKTARRRYVNIAPHPSANNRFSSAEDPSPNTGHSKATNTSRRPVRPIRHYGTPGIALETWALLGPAPSAPQTSRRSRTPKGTKVKRSCTYCTAKKIRCDDDGTCKNCTSRGLFLCPAETGVLRERSEDRSMGVQHLGSVQFSSIELS